RENALDVLIKSIKCGAGAFVGGQGSFEPPQPGAYLRNFGDQTNHVMGTAEKRAFQRPELRIDETRVWHADLVAVNRAIGRLLVYQLQHPTNRLAVDAVQLGY